MQTFLALGFLFGTTAALRLPLFATLPRSVEHGHSAASYWEGNSVILKQFIPGIKNKKNMLDNIVFDGIGKSNKCIQQYILSRSCMDW